MGIRFAAYRDCINSTSLCKRLCYGNGMRYQSDAQKDKHYKTCEYLLAEGGPDLLAENLAMLVDQARPRDWLTARVTGVQTAIKRAAQCPRD